MKKLFALTVAMLSMIGMSANPITPEKALQIAQEYMVPGHTMTMQTQAKSRRASAVSAPYYVISRGENQGYVIVAGDDCMPEILGYTEQGDFDVFVCAMSHYGTNQKMLTFGGSDADKILGACALGDDTVGFCGSTSSGDQGFGSMSPSGSSTSAASFVSKATLTY